MNGNRFAAKLIEAGLDPADLPSRQRLIDTVSRAFEASYGTAPTHAWWVPGRVEVFGKHTDYAGGRTLVAAVPRGFIFTARARPDDQVHVLDAVNAERFVATRDRAGTSLRGWRHYAAVAARRLRANFPGALLGVDVVFGSDLPRASGMSSSSALVVGLATSLVETAGLRDRREWRANLTQPQDEAGYYACIENGHTFGTLAGDSGVGTHGGSEDHAAILTAVPRHLSAFSFVPMRPIAQVRVPDDWRFVIAPSGVRAAKTGSARERYNRLSRGAEILVELWNGGAAERADSLAGALGSAEAADRLRATIDASRIPGWPPASLRRRLDHFIREDARIPSAVDAFRTGNREALTALASASQTDADRLLDTQVPETRALAVSAPERGAFAACSFGAGFGGSVWALVDAGDAARFAASWHPSAFVAMPGPPVTSLVAR